jgi:elongation factor Ts
MAEISAKDVQRLRQATGVGMMDAKKALQENDGDFEEAVKWLRVKGLSKAANRADRENTQGAVATYVSGNAGAIVELKSETDFVAKSPDFVNLAGDLAELVATKGEAAIDERAKDVEDLKLTLKENIEVGRVVRFEADPANTLEAYLHVQNDRGVNAVMLELEGGDQNLAHEVAMHAAWSTPKYVSREDAPADVVAAERQVLEDKARNEGKPDNVIPKIVEGGVNAFLADNTLLEQKYVKDNKQTIEHLLGGAKIKRFAQVKIGK